MKNDFRLFMVALLLFSVPAKFLYAQKSDKKNGADFAVTVQHPLLLGLQDINDKTLNLYQLYAEINWGPRKNSSLHFSSGLIYGRFFNSYNPWDGTKSMFGIDFSILYGREDIFLELGAGTDLMGLTKAIIGYRLYLMKNFIIKAQVIPTSGFLWNYAGCEDIPNYIDFLFGIGYKFGDNATKNIRNGIKFFFSHSSIEAEAYLFSFDKESGPIPPIMLNYGFMPVEAGNFHLGINGGVGMLPDGDFFYQTGLVTLYGKKNHFAEAGVNLIFALLLNYNYEYKYSDYRLIQPQLGYRYKFGFPLYLRAAWAPYIRTLDWKRDGGFQQNFVFGIGYNF